MNALGTTVDVAAAVVAWHNRHPLARRIAPEQVHDVGVLHLPVALPPGSALWRGKPLLLFSADALYHAGPERLARWLRRHGTATHESPADWPHRRFEPEPRLVERADVAGAGTRLEATVLSAAVDVDGKRVRVLLTAGRHTQVFGSRAFSPPRVAVGSVLAAIAAAMSTLVLTLSWPGAGSDVAPAARLAALELPAGATAIARSEAAPAPSAEPAAVVPHPAVLARADIGPSPTEAASAPFSADPASAPGAPIGRIVAVLDTAQRDAARADSRARRAAAAASAPPSLDSLLKAHAFAVATEPTARRADANAQLAVVRSLMAQTHTEPATRLELMPAGRQWRVVWWPHATQALAEERLHDVRARGVRAEIVRF